MTNPPERQFSGPLFVIGMPRSGTKLLRGLLNQHPQISIPPSETEFFPWLAGRRERFGDLSQRAHFHAFYSSMRQIHYFRRMHELGGGSTEQAWYEGCSTFTPADLFETLLRHDSGVPAGSDGIWGDKSPSYIRHVGMLKRHFPDARFVHIVRDVRDYCLSIHNAWGKSMLRAAQRWADDVGAADDAGSVIGADFMTVRYEDLLDAPATVLSAICRLAGVDYVPSMSRLQHSVENLGAARGRSTIDKDNKAKFLAAMKPATVRRIEAVSWPLLERFGYPYDYRGRVRRIGRLHMQVLQAADAFNLARFHVAERGLKGGLATIMSLYRTSGNRRA